MNIYYLDKIIYILKRYSKLFKRKKWAQGGAYFDWAPLYDNKLNYKTKNKKVLIASSTGGLFNAVSLEGAIGAALNVRDINIEVLLCDEVLPACQECQISWYPKVEQFINNGPQRDLCKDCFWPAEKMFKSQNFKVHKYGQYLSDDDIEKSKITSESIEFDEIRNFQLDNIAIGEHAYAGTLRFYAVGTLEKNKNTEKVLRRYLQASLLTVNAMNKLLSLNQYESVFFNHGIYVPQGLIGEVCRKKEVSIVNWNPGYKKKTFIFSHNNTYHHTMMNEKIENWASIEWNDKIENELMTYLNSRWHGTQDWIWFHHEPKFDLEDISKKTGIDFNKPCIGALTSVMWDAVLHYPSNAFSNMIEWIDHTIKYYIDKPDLQLIIRVHPAEIRGTLPSNQKMCEEISKRYPSLPKNIFIIPPESDISTYALMMQCDSVIIYNTKMGVELSAMGIPVIVAGEAWIKNKGFATEVKQKKEYNNILSKLPLNKKLEEDKLLLAKKYAYHFFFRRMIPLNIMKPTEGNIPYKVGVDSINSLKPGEDPGLDIICNSIINKSEFIYPAEDFL